MDTLRSKLKGLPEKVIAEEMEKFKEFHMEQPDTEYAAKYIDWKAGIIRQTHGA